MRAAVLHAARDLRIEDRPELPLGPREVRVRIAAGGICGSDLHYYFDGRVGDFPVLEPLILGHEIAGVVVETGSEVEAVAVGDRVSVNPSSPCAQCRFCLMGRPNLCLRMRFLGSASTRPHSQGGFQELFVTDQRQCHVVPADMPLVVAAMAEPLSVALHAAARAGDVLGREVLVTGAGPIGALIVLALRSAGARRIAVTDISDTALGTVARIGADETVNVKTSPEALVPLTRDKGRFDVSIEASGAVSALGNCVECTRAGGRVVQVGMLPPGGVPVPVNRIMAKELELVGSYRFHEEFAWAVEALATGRIDVSPLLSGTFPVEEADEAFATAIDRERSMKVHLTF
jgi:L-idonate 5-dehydrogenase